MITSFLYIQLTLTPFHSCYSTPYPSINHWFIIPRQGYSYVSHTFYRTKRIYGYKISENIWFLSPNLSRILVIFPQSIGNSFDLITLNILNIIARKFTKSNIITYHNLTGESIYSEQIHKASEPNSDINDMPIE